MSSAAGPVAAGVSGVSPPASPELVADAQRWEQVAEPARSDLRAGELTERLGQPQSLISYRTGRDPTWASA